MNKPTDIKCKLIGLTGGLASGKDTAVKIFTELGMPSIDADVVSRQLTEPGTEATLGIIKHFGEEIASDPNTIDRALLRQRVFGNPADLKWLEEHLHPRVREEVRNQLAAVTDPCCLLVVPLLLEGRLHKICDGGVIVVDIPVEMQVERACKRDNISAELAESIIQRQMPRDEKLKRADYILDNSGDHEHLRAQVVKLHQQLAC